MRNAEYLRSLSDIDQLTVGGSRVRIEAWNVPVATEIAYAVAGEGMSIGGRFALVIEDAGDGRIGMELSEAADETDGILVGANGRLARSGRGPRRAGR